MALAGIVTLAAHSGQVGISFLLFCGHDKSCPLAKIKPPPRCDLDGGWANEFDAAQLSRPGGWLLALLFLAVEQVNGVHQSGLKNEKTRHPGRFAWFSH
jgi:hypothetical protein